MTLPVEDRALSGGADDKAFSPLQQRLQELSPVSATVHGPDAAAPGLRAQLIDGGEQFVILTDKILGAHGEKLLVEGREFAAVDFGSDDAAQPVAGVHFPGAAIPDLIQKFHLAGVLLAHIAEIQAQDGVGIHAAAAQAQQSSPEMRFQFFGLQIARETVFGLEQRNLFLQTASDIAQFHALTGLNPEQHLADEISQRLAETGGEFASEAGELGFQTRTNFAMLHRGRLQGRSGFFGENPSTTDSVPSHLSEMINLSPSITCTRLQQKLRKVLENKFFCSCRRGRDAFHKKLLGVNWGILPDLSDRSVYLRCTSLRRFCSFSPFCYFVESITYVKSIPVRGSTPALVVHNSWKPS